LTPFQSLWSNRLAILSRLLSEEPAMSETATSIVDIRQEVELPATPERVFRALTSEIGRWWTSPFRQTGPDSRLELIPEIGAPMIEYGAGGHQAIWGRIEEIQPPAKLYLCGRFAMLGAVAGRVHFDLQPVANGCKLTVTHQAVGPIAESIREAFVAGWRELIDRRLRAHLEAGVSV
jgi:uncharacterized protein YndB with AHSA1/START domain